MASPYRLAPETLGVFATRAETRPTPVGLSVAAIRGLDAEGLTSTTSTPTRERR